MEKLVGRCIDHADWEHLRGLTATYPRRAGQEVFANLFNAIHSNLSSVTFVKEGSEPGGARDRVFGKPLKAYDDVLAVLAAWPAAASVVGGRPHSARQMLLHAAAYNGACPPRVVAELLAANPHAAKWDVVLGHDVSKGVDRDAVLPLHLALLHDPGRAPPSAQAPAASVTALLRAYPGAARVPMHGRGGMLPLHLAADCPLASLDVLEAVLAGHPAARTARAVGPDESTGLKTAHQFAIAAHAPAEVVAFVHPKTGGARAGVAAGGKGGGKKKDGGCVLQ